MSSELDEIWALYADDGAQSLDVVEQSLLHLKENPSDGAQIAALFRAIHTFKGNARVLGLGVIETCAHATEDLIGIVRDENVPLDAEIISLLLEAGDTLRAMMNESLARRADACPESSKALIGRMETKIQQCRATVQTAMAAEPEAIIFEPAERPPLAQDTLYLEIFNGMAADTLKEARKLLQQLQAGERVDCGVLAASLEHLRFAAGQIGIAGWTGALADFLSLHVPTVADLHALIAQMQNLMSSEAPVETPVESLQAASVTAAPPDCFAASELEDFMDESADVPAPSAADRSMLAADPTYRGIFFDMVHDILIEMQAAITEFESDPQRARRTLASQVDRLLHASKQIGMPGWPELLAEFGARPEISFAEAENFITKLESTARRDSQAHDPAPAGGDGPAGTLVPEFFDSLPTLLASISTFGSLLVSGRPVDAAAFLASAAEIRSRAEALEFVRVADIAEQLAGEHQFTAFRRLELQLYEELTRIGQAMPSRVQGSKFVPAAVLQNWCADQAFDTLIELSQSLDEMRKHPAASLQCDGVIELLRLTCYACRHYGMETAAHLSMSLIDLFARARDDGTLPDPILLRIARTFSADLELLFDTVGNGGTPDMAMIEKLFEEAGNAAFTASGAISSTVIESRLGLPKSFRKVLTPESLKAAVAAMSQGERFYIVRAALNSDEQAAAKFLEWISSGAASVISNVTVFDGASTLFDFLLATPLNEGQLAESLAVLNPTRAALKIEMVLNSGQRFHNPGQTLEPCASAEAASAMRTAANQDLIPSDMLEGIGEIVTGQAMIYRMLGDLAAEDIVRTVEAELSKAGGEWSKAQAKVRLALESFTGRIEKAYQAEAQLGGQLERLQEEAIAVRARPAALLTKPLEAFAETVARENGREIDLTISGEDLVLDHAMLEELKPHLRTLIAFCAAQSIEQPGCRVSLGKSRRGKIQLALVRSDERVLATLDDDGAGLRAVPEHKADALFAETRTALRSRGGGLRIESPAGGGIRFHVSLPMAMVVLDGMVVRVAGFRYVIPLEAIQRIVHSSVDDVMRISAEGRQMLKLGHEDVLPVHVLGAAVGEGFLQQNASAGQRSLFVVVGKRSQRVALMVDELMGQQLVLIRPLRGYLTGIRGVTGCALLGGGEVGMVLDIGRLLNPVEREEAKQGHIRRGESGSFPAELSL